MSRLVAVACVLALASAAAGGAATPYWNHWLCFPGDANDWCSVDLTTDVFTADGTHTTVSVSVPANPPIDCFYLYPTVAEDKVPNAPLVVHPEERETAITQAARFSHVCRVYAPLYRQVTGYGRGNYEFEYDDIKAAWDDYLAHYNRGRGVVLIGHSEGSFLFERLISAELAQIRKVLVSAILLGGDVQVDASDRYYGIPACRSLRQTGCIVAYSSWDRTPPANAAFQNASKGTHVLCVNPAAPAGGRVPIMPLFAGINPQGIVPYYSKYVAYHWVKFPGLYTGECVRQGKRAWLRVTRIKHAGDKRPMVYEALAPSWGLHAADVNITLADLVNLVEQERATWLARH